MVDVPEVEQHDPAHAADAFKRHRLLRAAVTVMTGTVLQKIIGLLFIAVFAHSLNRRNLDTYIFAVAFGLFFETISDFGVDFLFNRELNQRPPSEQGRVIGSAILAKSVSFTLTLALAFAATGLRPESRLVAMIATSGLLCGLTGTFGLALQASNRNVIPEISQIAGSFAAVVGLGFAVKLDFSVTNIVLTQTLIRFAVTLIAYPFLRKALATHVSYDWGLAKKMLRDSAPLAIGTAAVIVFTRFDQLLLGAIGKAGELSGYGVALRVMDGANFIAIAIATVSLPTFSHLESYDPARLRRLSTTAVRYLAVLFLPLTVAATLLGGPLLRAVFGHRFGAQGDTLALLAWGNFVGCCFLMMRPVLIAKNRTGYMAWLSIAAAILNVGLNLVLIPKYGALGAAWASLAGYATPFAIAAFLPVVRDSFATPLLGAIRPLIAAGAVLVIANFMSDSVEVRVALLVVLVPLATLATRATSIGEIRGLARSFVKGH